MPTKLRETWQKGRGAPGNWTQVQTKANSATAKPVAIDNKPAVATSKPRSHPQTPKRSIIAENREDTLDTYYVFCTFPVTFPLKNHQTVLTWHASNCNRWFCRSSSVPQRTCFDKGLSLILSYLFYSCV